eukprot:jgi/Mesen1/1149/ME001236S00029
MGAQLMGKYGVNVPKGLVGTTPDEVANAAKEIAPDGGEVVIKSQILAGGRGLGTFKNGFKGGVHIVKAGEAKSLAEKMLGQILVTKQTGEEGKPLLVAQKLALVNEMYFGIALDRASAGPVIIACSKGGTSIEDLAEKYPDMIIKHADKKEAAEQVKKMYELFRSTDCTLVEINPLAETADGLLVAADAKLNFDDNASFRQKEIFAMRDQTQEDPREVAAAAADLNYIGLFGEIGCMVNGAGLAMATMDIIQLHGSTPANFLDVGGNASEGQPLRITRLRIAEVP